MSFALSAHSREKNGTWAATVTFAAWGFMPIYWRLLSALPAFEILNHRIVWSFIFLSIFLLLTGRLGPILQIFTQPKNILLLFCSACLLAGNWLIFIWAVNANHVLDASLGAYITPLINIFMGRLFFKDSITPLAWVAIALAAGGVAYQVYCFGSLPLVSLGLGTSFAFYGLLRKIVSVEALPGLFIESALLLPLACCILIWLGATGRSVLFAENELHDWIFIVFLGPVTCIPLWGFAYATRRIRLTVLGLLQYLTPSINFLLGVFAFHEAFSLDMLIIFSCIWIALSLCSWESIHRRKPVKKIV